MSDATYKTLCGTCRWWDHKEAAQGEARSLQAWEEMPVSMRSADYPTTLKTHRIATCRWGENLVLPEWCDGLKGYRATNEAGTTERGCCAWEALPETSDA